MAGRWMDLGMFNAHGVPGVDALGAAIENMVTVIASPVDSDRGLSAPLRCLTRTDAGYEAMDRAGIHVSPHTLIAWLAEERTPNKANRTRLDAAYWDLRRRNVAPDLKHRLNNDGRGTRVEINPVNQPGVESKHQRDVASRSINVRGVWDRAVDPWLEEDLAELDAIRDQIIEDIGSAYGNVSSTGWAA